MSARPARNASWVVKSDDVLAASFGSETVLLNLRDGVYYGVEDVGARIWALVQQPVTLAALRDALVSEFDVEAERCEADLTGFVNDLADRGLVTIRTGS